jgi:hypothetical protein
MHPHLQYSPCWGCTSRLVAHDFPFQYSGCHSVAFPGEDRQQFPQKFSGKLRRNKPTISLGISLDFCFGKLDPGWTEWHDRDWPSYPKAAANSRGRDPKITWVWFEVVLRSCQHKWIGTTLNQLQLRWYGVILQVLVNMSQKRLSGRLLTRMVGFPLDNAVLVD